MGEGGLAGTGAALQIFYLTTYVGVIYSIRDDNGTRKGADGGEAEDDRGAES
jgi:hypothetical protein